MTLAWNLKGISKLAFLLLMVIFFLLGGIFSYIYTMGFYAPGEFNVPSHSLAIEDVHFSPENAFVFNVTVLNPSYSASDAIIDRIKVSTNDGILHSVDFTLPELPLPLASGESRTIRGNWDWGNYTGQTVDVYVLVVDGSGSAVKVKTASMNLTITSVIFQPSVTSNSFDVAVKSAGSPASVDINKIIVNGAEVGNVNPALPYQLNPNSTVTFTLDRNWVDLQNKTVSVAVQTKQGFAAYKDRTAPQVKLNLSSIQFFNTTSTAFYFNMTIQNSVIPPARVDINSITVYVEGQNFTIGTIDPSLPQASESNSTLFLMCTWDWSQFRGKNVTVTVYTAQGFKSSTEAAIPNTQ